MPMTLSDRPATHGSGRYLLRSLLFLAMLSALGAAFQQP
ncbi:MAG: hypothetical protein QG599_1533, partial [Pseudomonadota bacterium]|nr:hypothetical protein [Pseudomonadota bacterium]